MKTEAPTLNYVDRLQIHNKTVAANLIYFEDDLAVKLGLPAAIMYTRIINWLKTNADNPKAQFEGMTWSYQTYKQWGEQVKCLHWTTIRKALQFLEAQKLLVSGQLFKFDRDKKKNCIKFYRLPTEAELELEEAEMTPPLKHNMFEGPETYLVPGPETYLVPGCIEITKDKEITNSLSNDKEYMRVKDQNKVKVQNSSSKTRATNNPDFDRLWALFPNGLDKKACKTEFERITRTTEANLLIHALQAQMEEWQLKAEVWGWKPQFKHPINWLRGECWLNPVKTRSQLETMGSARSQKAGTYQLARDRDTDILADEYQEQESPLSIYPGEALPHG